jgi:hypothetical protein
MSIPFIKQFDDFAEAMATSNPNRPIQEGVAAFGRTVCDRISARPELFAPTILQSPLVAACTPYWNSQGYDAPGPIPPPFTGGQCVGVNYRVEGTFTPQCGATNNNWFSTSVPGPIEGVIDFGIGYAVRSGSTDVNYSVTTFSGDRALTDITREGISCGDIPFAAQQARGNNPIITNVIRLDGLPDDCGDLPTEIGPGDNPAPDPGPLPPGTGPTVNIRGGVVVVLPPTLEINPDLTVELPIGEINLGTGTGGGPAEEPLPGDELAGEGSGTGGGENDFGDPPDGERWVGCCIAITSAPVGSGVIPSSIPHDVYPIVVGNARLKFQGPSGPLTYDTPIQKRQETSCLWEPVRGMAPVGCFVNLLPGYSYTVRPYSVPLEQ